ncbi:MAG: cyanophycin synthetase, partial [Pseudomonadota bacterium]
FGEAGDLRLVSAEVAGETTVMQLEIAGERMAAKLGAPGVHFARNALAALGAVAAVGADLARAGMALGAWRPPDGRGQRQVIPLGPGGLDGEVTLIDESYNANPASMTAALAVLAAARPTHNIGRVAKGRRIAFLGDMLELGPEEHALHAGLASTAEAQSVDLIHTCGPRMRALHEALPAIRRGQWAEDSTALAALVPRLLDAGDVCMVKGSLGSAMARVVAAVTALGSGAPGEDA